MPPLERAPASNLRAVDSLGNTLDTLRVDQQVQITADIRNDQTKPQQFAMVLQIQDSDGVTVSLSWSTGSLVPGQSLGQAVSWIPTEIGEYTATVFVWESVTSPTALSPSLSIPLTVNS